MSAFRPAQRSNAKPIIGLYSESGGGKTYSALLLARGFVGPNGRIAMIETESGRGESYSDPHEYPEFAGTGTRNYEAAPLTNDFSPKAYYALIRDAEKERFDALIVDSCSHEWESTGGVLDMAAERQAAGAKSMLVWQEPKIMHKRFFMLPLTGCSIPLVIMCMRAKYPMQEVTKNGKKEWVRSTKLEPIQSEDVLYEMFIHGWLDQEQHNFYRTKCTSKALESTFVSGQPITLDTGKQLALWAKRAQLDERRRENQPLDQGATLLEEGLAAADYGSAAMAAWWKGLNGQQKDIMLAYGGALRQRATEADTKGRGAVEDEAEPPYPPPPSDPFPDNPDPEPEPLSYTLIVGGEAKTFDNSKDYLVAYEAVVKELYTTPGRGGELARFDTANKPLINSTDGLPPIIEAINKNIRKPIHN